MMKLSKFFEFAYLAVALFFIYEAFSNWNTERDTSYLYIAFVVICLFMFFFRRRMRHKFEKRQK